LFVVFSGKKQQKQKPKKQKQVKKMPDI